MEDEPLTERQRRYVQHRAAGMDSRSTALAAGFSGSYSKVAAHRLGKIPAVARALAEIRQKGCDMAAYGVNEAMTETDEAAAFAKKHKNSMALVKARELKMKLAGLLIDRVQEVPVDLKGALEQARLRIINPQSLIPQRGEQDEQDDGPSSPGLARWRRDTGNA